MRKSFPERRSHGKEAEEAEPGPDRCRRPRPPPNQAEVKPLLAAWILTLSMPEAWVWLTPWWDIWAADQVATGLLVTTLGVICGRLCSWIAGGLAVAFGIARTSCVGLWPNASDASGSICDLQTGLPLTVGVIVLALAALKRKVRP